MLLFLLLLAVASCLAGPAPPLPAFDIDLSSIGVSGPSSGAAFADQMHVAFSEHISGSGTWAGVPYICFSRDGVLCAETPSIINVDALVRETAEMEKRDNIDRTINLANDRVYIHHGTEDRVVHPEAAEKMWKYWNNYVMDSSQILLKNDLHASHCVTSDHAGTPCGISDHELFIENCNYNSPFHMLNHLLGGDLNPPNPPGALVGRLAQFDQDEFFNGDAHEASMDTTGYVYIPPACENKANQCRLHVFYHGCVTQYELVGTEVITSSGFLEIADANNIVIIFPQTIGLVVNPMGCYNWFGYLGDLLFQQYASRDGPQMLGNFLMIKRAAGIL